MQKIFSFILGVLFMAVFVATAVLASAILSQESEAGVDKAMLNLKRTVVMVRGVDCLGSGSIVAGKSGKNYILTNAHVCNCAGYRKGLDVTFEDGTYVHGGGYKMDWGSDLCASPVEKTTTALRLAPRLLPLTEINTKGFPGGHVAGSHGHTLLDLSWSYDVDIAEVGACPEGSKPYYAFNGNVSGCTLTFTSTITNLFGRPGSSGSPVVNDDGELVGVMSSWHPGSEYDAGMTTYSQTKKFLEGL